MHPCSVTPHHSSSSLIAKASWLFYHLNSTHTGDHRALQIEGPALRTASTHGCVSTALPPALTMISLEKDLKVLTDTSRAVFYLYGFRTLTRRPLCASSADIHGLHSPTVGGGIKPRHVDERYKYYTKFEQISSEPVSSPSSTLVLDGKPYQQHLHACSKTTLLAKHLPKSTSSQLQFL